MQRRGVGEVIQHTGHKVIDLATDEPLELHGPDMAEDVRLLRSRRALSQVAWSALGWRHASATVA